MSETELVSNRDETFGRVDELAGAAAVVADVRTWNTFVDESEAWRALELSPGHNFVQLNLERIQLLLKLSLLLLVHTVCGLDFRVHVAHDE